MARACSWFRLHSLYFLISYLLTHSLTHPYDLPGGYSPTAMILPLLLSPSNSSRPSIDINRRRHLQKQANAHMRLHDDLLTHGYYTTRLWIGTPPQEFALIVDSGSTVTYVPCSTCQQCGKHLDPRFQPDLSRTFRPLECSLDCTCEGDDGQCTYERQYAEMSSSSGVLGEDIISFGKESALEPQRAVFGCENSETGDLFTQHADGIIGLGRGRLSIMDQLVDKGAISDSFSLCYGGMGIGGGAMVLGGISPPPDMVFSHSDPFRSPYYNIELKEIHVAGKLLQLKPGIFNGKHGTVLDSGTTYAYLPEAAFVEFRDAVLKTLHPLKRIHGPDPTYNDICFSGAGSDVSKLSKSFPKVDMVFDKGGKLSLAPENYLFRHSKVHGAYCLGIFQNGNDPTTLLGGIIVRNTLVTYDRENQKVGFWKTNCSDLWERLQFPGAPSPVASASFHRNPAIAASPTFPPSGLPGHIIPGLFKVGIITFDMSLNINYSDLVPYTTELAEHIAHELEVNPHQVHLLNFTSNGNGSFIRWAIFPEGSADYISNTTAMSIIFRLIDHRVRLPDTIGSYQLIEWKVVPPLKRTVWQQHFLAVIVGGSVAVLVIFSTFIIWFVWRQRQKVLGTYKPIDTRVAEQELQPL